MVHRALKISAAVAALAALSASLVGASLPESYPLGDADANETARVDQNLADWLAQHVDQPSPFELDDHGFKAFVAKQDAVTASYLAVARANRAAEPAARPAVEAAMAQMASDREAARSSLGHPLLPALYAELLASGALSAVEVPAVLAGFAAAGSGTCAEKQLVFAELDKDLLAPLTDDGLRDLLTRVNTFRSNNFKKGALRKLLRNLPEARQVAVAETLLGVSQPYPAVIKSSAWLRGYAEKVGKLAADGPAAGLEEARQLAGKRLCSAAKDTLLATLGALKAAKAASQDVLESSVVTAKAVDGCFRARAPELRAELWKNLTPVLTELFGQGGWAEARLRLGYIHWTAGALEDAKALFQEVVAKADGKAAMRRFEARAVFALARIASDEQDEGRAAKHFNDYTQRFADQESFEEALMAYVLIQVAKQDFEQALAPLAALIDAQDGQALDDRSTGAMSFALFWSGRIHLEQGRRRAAAEMWRRVASEYYSTYYGAIGHFMLEQLVGRRLKLQPSRTPPFRMHALRDAFAPEGRLRVRRVEAMLKLGLKDEAICELEELDTGEGRPEKLLVRALMLHAAGEWLDAIKAYDALPRSFRNSLPAGVERLLFPKRFEAQIRDLAAKAEVDPDLVLAIIRQESVFNPMARSPVGAMGLMQLMPATAKVEVKRLGGAYISAEGKQQMRQRVGNPLNLLVADTNLTLGIHHVRTLLARYKSPVYVLSAYNASPSAAQRWMTTIPSADILAFIERIPYKETRAYVKLVMRNYFYYKRWYGDPSDGLSHLATLASPLIAMARQEAKAPPPAEALPTATP